MKTAHWTLEQWGTFVAMICALAVATVTVLGYLGKMFEKAHTRAEQAAKALKAEAKAEAEKGEQRLLSIERGQTDLKEHLDRQDEISKETLDKLNEHIEAFGMHTKRDEECFQTVSDQVKALGVQMRRRPKPAAKKSA